jgi:trimeric autotransporter adhesin
MRVVLAGFAVLFGVMAGFGQSFQGGVRGVVNDSGGAMIPGVEITLTNEETNVSRSAVSNEIGQYVFSAVAPGKYKLRASLPSFKSYERSGLTIGTQQFIVLDVTLEVGAVTDEVSVVADAPLIETATASNAISLPNLYLSTLPNTGRNAFMMAMTVPTVVHNGNPFYVRQQDQTNASLMSLSGGPMRGNNYLMDGVPITDLRNRPVFFPNIESVAEVKVQVNTYDAEMGRTGGGVFNTTMKSGSNDWHGSAYIQQRPQPWAARNAFAAKKADFQYWLYGGSGGGHIVKDRTFFWASTEGYKTGTPWTLAMSVPTAAMKQGDFSGVADIYDPTTTRPDPANPGRYLRDQFAGNKIPANRMNPVGKALMQYFPDPNQPGLVNNFASTDVLHDVSQQITGKVDHTLNAKNSLSGTFLWYFSHEPFPVYFRGTPAEIADQNNYKLYRKVYAPVVNYTMTPDAESVLTLRYGYNWFQDNCIPDSDGFDLAKLGLDPAFVNAAPVKQFPVFNFSDGYRGLGQPHFLIHWTSHNLLGNYSRLMGRHNVRFGGAYREIGVDFTDKNGGVDSTSSGSTGAFNFDRVFTQLDPNRAVATQGDPIASLLLGYPARGFITTAVPLNFFTRYYAGYVQDDIRVNSALTVNAGLRYEFETDLQERNNQMVVGFDRTATNPIAGKVTDASIRDRIKGGLMYAGVGGNQTHQGDPQKLAFQPRLGFAYNLHSGTVVRGGFGVFFAPLQLFFPGSTVYGAQGYVGTTDYLASTDSNLTPAGVLNNPFPAGIRQPTGNTLGLLQNVGETVRFIDQNNKRGYAEQYSLDIQHELPGGIALTLGYVGSRSLHMSAAGTSSNTVNINALPISALSLGSAYLTESVTNPFFGLTEAGVLGRSATVSRRQLLRPFPEFGDVLMVRPSTGYGKYNSFTIKAERRVDSTGFGFRSNYTFARTLDNYFGEASYYGGRIASAIDNFDLNREYGLSYNDVKHRFNLTPMFDLPFGRGKRWADSGIADKLIGGWNVSPNISYQTGMPSAIAQQTNNTQLFNGIQRPNLVSGQDPCTSGSTIERMWGPGWYNKNAFVQADSATLGTGPRTYACRLPSQFNIDASIRKSIPVSERMRAVLRLEILNATNTPKFLAPEYRVGNSNFGVISGQAGFPRIIQYMIRFEY